MLFQDTNRRYSKSSTYISTSTNNKYILPKLYAMLGNKKLRVEKTIIITTIITTITSRVIILAIILVHVPTTKNKFFLPIFMLCLLIRKRLQDIYKEKKEYNL